MTNKNRLPSVLIKDMIQYAKESVQMARSTSKDEFSSDIVLQRACLYSLTVIGEIAAKFPSEKRKRYAGVPWREISDMRNILVHWYHGVDLVVVWKTLSYDLIDLIPKLEAILILELEEEKPS